MREETANLIQAVPFVPLEITVQRGATCQHRALKEPLLPVKATAMRLIVNLANQEHTVCQRAQRMVSGFHSNCKMLLRKDSGRESEGRKTFVNFKLQFWLHVWFHKCERE